MSSRQQRLVWVAATVALALTGCGGDGHGAPSHRDGPGNPARGDDRILRIVPTAA